MVGLDFETVENEVREAEEMDVRDKFSIDRQIAKIISQYIIIRLLYNVFKRILNLGSTSSMLFLGLLIAIWVLVNFNTILNALIYQVNILVIAEICFILIYAFSFLLDNVSVSTLSRYIAYSCFLCCPLFALTSNVGHIDLFYDEMLKWTYIITLIGLLVVFSRHSNSEYNMSYSYLMLHPLIINSNEVLKRVKIKNVIFLLINLVLMVIYGSRGPLLCWVLFILFRILLTNKITIGKIVSLIAIAAFALNYDQIGNYIISFCAEHGISNRTINLIFTDLTYNSGRSELQQSAIGLLRNHMLTGLGAASDIDLIGQYPHNIVIEILYDYGVVIGSILIFIIAVAIIYFLRRKEYRDISIAYVSLGFFALFVSGTYLTSWSLYMLFGLMAGRHLHDNNVSEEETIENG